MKILLIGDFCYDQFIECDVNRFAPEAPVPVAVPVNEIQNPGMAGNVLSNLLSLSAGGEFVPIFPKTKSTKTRYVDRKTGHHFLRVDTPDTCEPLDIETIGRDICEFDAVVISDYDKGFLPAEVLRAIAHICREQLIPLFIDTKKLLSDWSADAIVKINEVEFAANLGTDNPFRPFSSARPLIVTRGGDGMDLYDNSGKVEYHSPAIGNIEVKDGAGCGDSVLAALVVRYLENGRDLKDAMDWANKVGAIAVSKRGVVAVKREEVK